MQSINFQNSSDNNNCLDQDSTLMAIKLITQPQNQIKKWIYVLDIKSLQIRIKIMYVPV